MPWTAADADKHKKGLTPAQKKKWASIANGVLKSCKAKGGKNCEGKAIRVANSKFSVVEISSPWMLYELDDHDEYFYFAKKDDTKKPGGSNKGKYKKGPFCGPSGGAPKGTYPVNTRKRAIAAIAYARHAPNPQGIKNCVYRHWPDLKKKSNKKQSDEEMIFEMKKNEVPKGALRFMGEGEAHCEFADVDGKKIPKLMMVAYSGKVIKNHWWWGNLSIDLDGMKFEGTKFPILESHDTSKKIAFTSKPKVTDDYQLQINSDKTHFVDTEASAEFQKLSSDGFPYQASIYAKPTSIERLEEGATADVNGYKFKGPGTIWRECIFKEASVCVFGADNKTLSQAFSHDVMESIDADVELFADGDTFNNNDRDPMEGGERMDWEKFKEENPDEAKKFEDDITKRVTDDVTKELTKKFDDEKKASDEEKETLSEQIAQLQKNDALRSQREMALEAGNIVNSCLAESDVIDSFHDKVRNMINYTKFVKDGVLDKEKFAEAVKAEVKDWEDKGATSKIMGTGFAEKEPTGEAPEKTQLAEENKNAVADLLRRAGQKSKE